MTKYRFSKPDDEISVNPSLFVSEITVSLRMNEQYIFTIDSSGSVFVSQNATGRTKDIGKLKVSEDGEFYIHLDAYE